MIQYLYLLNFKYLIMKTINFFRLITLFTLFLFSTMSYSQNNTSIEIKYRMKPDRSVANENLKFNFNISNGKLTITDYDFNTQKSYLIKFDKTFYDNAGLFNVAYSTDIVNHTLEKRPKSEIGLFVIIYDEKNGNLIGVKTVFENSDVETYFTFFGAKMLGKI